MLLESLNIPLSLHSKGMGSSNIQNYFVRPNRLIEISNLHLLSGDSSNKTKNSVLKKMTGILKTK